MHSEHVWALEQVESQAHALAATFLMPDRDIRDELPSYAD
jgi:Zn-dependent peptidase ImmA (M78 family)